MTTSFCFIPGTALTYFVCYGIVALVGLLVSILELLNRYGMGNRTAWVLWGTPQFCFYTVNVVAAILTLFISEASGATSLIESASVNFPQTCVKCLQVGLAAMFVLRSRLITVEKKDKSSKVDLGPAQILNIIYRYLDRLTDQSRGKNAMKEVEGVMVGFSGSLTDLTALCLKIPEAIPDADIEKLRRTLDVINRNSKNLSPHAQALLMGLELQKEVGTDTLQAAVDALAARKAGGASAPSTANIGDVGTETETRQGEDMVSLDSRIEEELRRIKDESGAGKVGSENDVDGK
jgi:hypothetical protein